jgi:hypothetical protein
MLAVALSPQGRGRGEGVRKLQNQTPSPEPQTVRGSAIVPLPAAQDRRQCIFYALAPADRRSMLLGRILINSYQCPFRSKRDRLAALPGSDS